MPQLNLFGQPVPPEPPSPAPKVPAAKAKAKAKANAKASLVKRAPAAKVKANTKAAAMAPDVDAEGATAAEAGTLVLQGSATGVAPAADATEATPATNSGVAPAVNAAEATSVAAAPSTEGMPENTDVAKAADAAGATAAAAPAVAPAAAAEAQATEGMPENTEGAKAADAAGATAAVAAPAAAPTAAVGTEVAPQGGRPVLFDFGDVGGLGQPHQGQIQDAFNLKLPGDTPVCTKCGHTVDPCQKGVRLNSKTKPFFTCRSCNSKDSQLYQMFGKWPLAEFKDLPASEQQAFYRSAAGGGKELKRLVTESICKRIVDSRLACKKGPFLPLSVWEKQGYNVLDIEAKAPYEHHPVLGDTYQVLIHETGHELREDLVRQQLIELLKKGEKKRQEKRTFAELGDEPRSARRWRNHRLSQRLFLVVNLIFVLFELIVGRPEEQEG